MRKERAMPELKFGHYSDVEAKKVEVEGARDVTIRWLVSDRDGAPHFQMRLFEVAPGGGTPLHTHAWEHEIFIVKGTGAIALEGGEKPFAEGHFIFVPAGALHSFRNTGAGPMQFLCMVPSGTK
ncbi:MAG: cupin domain-containing protein [Candidatus Latescibacterota bacterium]|jgi:quercetin dioxygenase-like cupin family protein|nr:MAG: cupin domain-containing protein [Candidatus Latescibacterota bacterium]